jgi:hypothetical protein
MERQTLRTEVDLSVVAELPSGSRFLAIRALRYFRSHELHRLILPGSGGFVRGIRCLPDDREETMSTVNLNSAELVSATNGPFEEAHMAAAAFLARYSGRTLETYRFDLRSYFEWCAGVGLAVLEAKRPHIEL